MPTFRRKLRLSTKGADAGCVIPTRVPVKMGSKSLKAHNLLHKQGVIVDRPEQQRFVDVLERSVRQRNVIKQRWTARRLKHDDIISLILAALDAGELDEAIWRSFLAAHFGRPSANSAVHYQLESASLLLCGFGPEPKWMWSEVCTRPKLFRNWLYSHANELQSLSFGNHRKYESQRPALLWIVIESFIALATEHDGPMALLTPDPGDDSEDPFQALYRRLSKLHRFGRTGRFDFLVMLLDLGLISAEPKTCYLRGATGPKKGAVRLWGKRGIEELEGLAAELAERCRVSLIAVEDALCNWQK